jgi:hypothetical protein
MEATHHKYLIIKDILQSNKQLKKRAKAKEKSLASKI